jgi:hypothetical protein
VREVAGSNPVVPTIFSFSSPQTESITGETTEVLGVCMSLAKSDRAAVGGGLPSRFFLATAERSNG